MTGKNKKNEEDIVIEVVEPKIPAKVMRKTKKCPPKRPSNVNKKVDYPSFAKNSNDIEFFAFVLMVVAAAICICTFVFFCGYGIPMFFLELSSNGDNQKVIVSPFSNYSDSTYHVARPCIYPPVFEHLEGSFPCNNSDMHWISNNETFYCPHTYGCLPVMEFPYLTCVSLDQSCTGVDLTPHGTCMKVAELKQNDEFSKVILFDTVSTLSALQCFLALFLIPLAIIFAVIASDIWKTKHTQKNFIVTSGCFISIAVVIVTLLFILGLVYICTVENVNRIGHFVNAICFDTETKEIFSSVDSRYSGTLAVFIIHSIVCFILFGILVMGWCMILEECAQIKYDVEPPI